MEFPDYEAIGKAQAKSERYEVIKKPNGEYKIIVMGSGSGSGAVCSFPVRDGRDHWQKARAELMAKAPGLAAKCEEYLGVIMLLRSALSDMVCVDNDDPRSLLNMRSIILTLPDTLDRRVMLKGIDALISTTAFREF
jgi:hypothetical protein